MTVSGGMVSGPLAAVLVAVVLVAAGCAPMTRPMGEIINQPLLAGDTFHTGDGERLPLRSWSPETGKPKAVIVALHGFNDYSNFFAEPGRFLAKHGIQSYAYDQRGFGGTPGRGLWPGVETLGADLRAFARLVRDRHRETPLYLLGDSMGGAVIMTTITLPGAPEVKGVILAAPAVWGRVTMPWYQRLALWVGVRIMPWVKLTGQGLRLKPSDNTEMLKALGRDPLVIKSTRVDTIYGLTNLMDLALERSGRFDWPALILYGEKDEIIPREPTKLMLERLPRATRKSRRIALYKDGYHMLLRDLGAETPLADIVHWIGNPDSPLPSGADNGAEPRLAGP